MLSRPTSPKSNKQSEWKRVIANFKTETQIEIETEPRIISLGRLSKGGAAWL